MTKRRRLGFSTSRGPYRTLTQAIEAVNEAMEQDG